MRQQWYKGRGSPITNVTPVRSLKKMAAGKAIEPFWRAALEEAGFTITLPKERIPIGEDADGEVDGILSEGQPASSCLLELKDLGQWSYQDVLIKGVKIGAPEYYMQVQLYLYGCIHAGLINDPRCVFLAGMADSSGFLWYWRRIKKQEIDPPDFYLEVIEYDEAVAQWGLDRMKYIGSILKSSDVPPSNFEPLEGRFPCGTNDVAYCGFRDQCVSDGGLVVDREAPV